MGSVISLKIFENSEEELVVPPDGYATTKNSSSSIEKRGDNQRFTDVGKEPDKMLTPLPPVIIHQHSSSTSLQEVIKPICHLVEDLPERAARSLDKMQVSKRPLDSR